MTPEELTLRRRRLKLTKRELGVLLGVSRETLSAWERGKRFPPATMLNKALTFVELEIMIGSEVIGSVESQLTNEDPLPRVIRHTYRALKDYQETIRTELAAHPNATLAELCELVTAAGGPSVRRHTMGRELKRLNLSLTRTGPLARTRILQADDELMIRSIVEEHPKATRAELCGALKDAGGPTVSLKTMSKVLKRLSLKLRPAKGGPVRDRMLKDYEEMIRAAVDADPKVTINKLCEVITTAGGPCVSRSTMKRALKLLQLKLQVTVRQRGERHTIDRTGTGAFAHTGL
jgi:transcriptional regulator with XRE-family HTH domain